MLSFRSFVYYVSALAFLLFISFLFFGVVLSCKQWRYCLSRLTSRPCKTHKILLAPKNITDVAQFFLLPLVLGQTLFALLLSNTLYAVAFSWYWYITHLGYRSLPFLSNTEIFLFPIAAIAMVFILNIIGYPFSMGWNASRLLAQVYFHWNRPPTLGKLRTQPGEARNTHDELSVERSYQSAKIKYM